MRKLIISLISFSIFFSCLSTDYIRIGEEQSALSWNAEVAVLTSAQPEQKYGKIGLLRIRGGDLEKRVDRAKLYARKKGGNAIIAREVGVITDPETDTVVEQIGASTYETQEFLIVKMEEGTIAPEAQTAMETETPDAEIPSEVPDADVAIAPEITPSPYAALPRATYKQLISDYKSLEGEKFKGTLFPKKIYKIPNSLKESTGTGDRLVSLTTKSGRSILYLIVDKGSLPAIIDKIKAGEELNFVYSPVSVYITKNTQRPVIKFVEEITGQ